jgi:hypothetical protein
LYAIICKVTPIISTAVAIKMSPPTKYAIRNANTAAKSISCCIKKTLKMPAHHRRFGGGDHPTQSFVLASLGEIAVTATFVQRYKD